MKFLRFFTKHLPLATVAMLMAACASEDYVGNRELHEANENGRPVSFGLVAAPQTRAVYGGEAAGLLNNNFVVWGEKKVGEETQTVFDNYQLNYVTNSASTTTSNSAGWEYVGYKNLPNGVSASETSQAVADIPAYANSSANAAGVDQTIKYWDYGASQYTFFAYSLGKGVEVTPATEPKTYTYAKASHMTSSGYTLSGSGEQLKASYVSNKKTIAPSGSSGTEVELQFRNFASNVRLAFYETVPGYSVNNVQFYPASDGTVGGVPYLYASNNLLPTQGTYNITFDGNGKATTQLITEGTPPVAADYTNNISFGDALTYTATKEYMEPQEVGTTPYIGRTSDTATPTTTVTMLPNPDGTDLYLKVDYTLVSRDDSQEEIEVIGALATVPATFARWQPNYTYTYLFKISDNTDGHIGAVQGLYPITLDAVVNVDADGTQETVTTVTEPSITTYQNGSDYAATGAYNAGTGHDIYVVVYDETDVATLTVTGEGDINAWLYSVTNVKGSDPAVGSEPALDITEETVGDVLTPAHYDSGSNTYSSVDANKWVMTITPLPTALSTTDKIADTADGKDLNFGTSKVAYFTPTAGTYVFQYMKAAAVYYDEVTAAAYNATLTGALNSTDPLTAAQATDYNAKMSGSKSEGDTLTVEEAAAYNATLDGHKTTSDIRIPAKYQYKVIKVKAATP